VSDTPISPHPPDDKATDKAAIANLVTEAQTAKAIAEAKTTEAEAAQAVAEAKMAEAKAAQVVAKIKAEAASIGVNATAAKEKTTEEVSESETEETAEETTTEDVIPKKGWLSNSIASLQDSLLPRPNYAPGETIKQVIHLAPYRATIPKVFAILGALVFFVAVLAVIFLVMTGPVNAQEHPNVYQTVSNVQLLMWCAFILALLLFIKSLQAGLAYKQWQFIMTDKRIIITTPDPDHGLFADSIYLKDGTIKVLDTNFSSSAMWIPMQIMTGARDVMLSTGAYEFMETGAKVKGGIRFPDVTPEDIKRLESLVFSGQK